MGSLSLLFRYSNYSYFSLLLTLAALFSYASASKEGMSKGWVAVADRNSVVGPGSCPPTCRLKCGRCWPCEAVHVPIQPGLRMPLEYYPEAWRCKCGNKLFVP